MPINYANYPPNWKQIRARIIERDCFRCKHCGVLNHSLILRSSKDAQRYVRYDADADCHYTDDGTAIKVSEIPAEFDAGKYTRVVLTVAHLDHDIANNDPANLAALCQRCHLLHDLQIHRDHAAETRRRKREVSGGQLSLL